MRPLVLILLASISFASRAAEIAVRTINAPINSWVVVQVFDNADAFTGFRKPLKEVRYRAGSEDRHLITDVPIGAIAVVAYIDSNGNGRLDRNFIGIPREPVGLSNSYRPKGPPSFQGARFQVSGEQLVEVDITFDKPLGDSGQWGFGIGAIVTSNPYLGADRSQTRFFPAITYLGERLQWLGPTLRYGIAGSGRLRLALSATYRFGAYEADDSPQLEDLDDRDNTLMAGFELVFEGFAGTELNLGYQHDVLDRIDGGEATFSISRAFSAGSRLRLTPAVGFTWMSRGMSNYDFGVSPSDARSGRTAYEPGESINLETSLNGLVELTDDWLIAFTVTLDFLDREITSSPIVDDRQKLSVFAVLTYTF